MKKDRKNECLQYCDLPASKSYGAPPLPQSVNQQMIFMTLLPPGFWPQVRVLKNNSKWQKNGRLKEIREYLTVETPAQHSARVINI